MLSGSGGTGIGSSTGRGGAGGSGGSAMPPSTGGGCGRGTVGGFLAQAAPATNSTTATSTTN